MWKLDYLERGGYFDSRRPLLLLFVSVEFSVTSTYVVAMACCYIPSINTHVREKSGPRVSGRLRGSFGWPSLWNEPSMWKLNKLEMFRLKRIQFLGFFLNDFFKIKSNWLIRFFLKKRFFFKKKRSKRLFNELNVDYSNIFHLEKLCNRTMLLRLRELLLDT